MHWNLGRIYLHLKSNTKLTTLPTLCDTGKLEWHAQLTLASHQRIPFSQPPSQLNFCLFTEKWPINCDYFNICQSDPCSIFPTNGFYVFIPLTLMFKKSHCLIQISCHLEKRH